MDAPPNQRVKLNLTRSVNITTSFAGKIYKAIQLDRLHRSSLAISWQNLTNKASRGIAS